MKFNKYMCSSLKEHNSNDSFCSLITLRKHRSEKTRECDWIHLTCRFHYRMVPVFFRSTPNECKMFPKVTYIDFLELMKLLN